MQVLARETITTIKDPRIIEARELNSATGRTRRQKCLLEGIESIQWALEAHLSVEHVFYHNALQNDAFLTALHERHVPCYAVSEGILKKISDTSYLIPYIGVAHQPQSRLQNAAIDDIVVVLDHVLDHGNLGTIIRTASAFGVQNIVSTSSELDLYFKKVVSASRGKVFAMNVQSFQSGPAAVAALKQKGYQVIATSPYAKMLQALAPLQAKPIALVVGNETEGVSDEVMQQADIVVQIPMSGAMESLNVGVATGISLYELKFRLVLTMLTHYIRATFGREVNVTARMLLMAFDARLRKVSDLNGWQVLLLMMLESDPTTTPEQIGKELAQELAIYGQELEALLQPLFEKRYVQHVQSNDEQKLQLTHEGKLALAHLWNVVEAFDHQLLADFSDGEKKQFIDFLQRVQANCAAIIKE